MTDEQLYVIAVTPIPRPKSITAMLYDVTIQSPDDDAPVVVAKFNDRGDANDYARRVALRHRSEPRIHDVKLTLRPARHGDVPITELLTGPALRP